MAHDVIPILPRPKRIHATNLAARSRAGQHKSPEKPRVLAPCDRPPSRRRRRARKPGGWEARYAKKTDATFSASGMPNKKAPAFAGATTMGCGGFEPPPAASHTVSFPLRHDSYRTPQTAVYHHHYEFPNSFNGCHCVLQKIMTYEIRNTNSTDAEGETHYQANCVHAHVHISRTGDYYTTMAGYVKLAWVNLAGCRHIGQIGSSQ
jgi:hypothetical protein